MPSTGGRQGRWEECLPGHPSMNMQEVPLGDREVEEVTTAAQPGVLVSPSPCGDQG